MGQMTLFGTFTAVECYRCHMLFGVPSDFDVDRRRDHKAFCCPSGHSQLYLLQSREEELKDKLQAEIRSKESWKEESERQARRAVSADMSRRATKGHLNKLKKRIVGGACPCCNRNFENLARHMKTKQAEYVKTSRGQ